VAQSPPAAFLFYFVLAIVIGNLSPSYATHVLVLFDIAYRKTLMIVRPNALSPHDESHSKKEK